MPLLERASTLMRKAAPTATSVRRRKILPHGLDQMARIAVDADGLGRPGGSSGAQDALRHSGSNGKTFGIVEDADLEVAKAASCGGKCWTIRAVMCYQLHSKAETETQRSIG